MDRRGRGRRRRPHGVRDRRDGTGRAPRLAPALLRGEPVRDRRRGRPHLGGLGPAPAGRLRADPARTAARAREPRVGDRPVGRAVGAGAARRPRGRHLLRSPLPRARPGPGRRARPAHALVREHRARAHGSRQAEPGAARGVGEHADGAARLQRDHREDDDRLGPRRAAVHDVHGRVRGAEGRDRRARPPARGDVPDPRGRGRRDVRRRAVPHGGGRRGVGRRGMRPRVREPGRGAGAVARDPVARAAGPALVPVRARLGVPAGNDRRGEEVR